MKFLFDLFPVILFFGSYSWAKNHIVSAQALADRYLSAFVAGPAIPESSVPILLATALAIVASALQIVYLFLRKKKIEATLWVSLVVITVFGGATIYFGSEEFIKWKPTVLYWLFGGALLLANLLFRKNLIRAMMEKKIQLPDPVWQRLNMAWIAFFAFMGVLNLYVAFWGGFETSTWVSFKLFGGMGLMLVFIIGQSVYLSRHLKNA
ncbi:septation protein A [Oxalobacter paraformigenes]|uniref:Inner membrane-spanning protein YciB n=1 Tax=Oxalobacter paraformigenes TaxID=556268 RepID=C3X712_9BURK|nr:septation protein A [Oxalobacter paraformigenes]EEO26925.1 intracellular septation protein A [Oxalobacter paraformigenes]